MQLGSISILKVERQAASRPSFAAPLATYLATYLSLPTAIDPCRLFHIRERACVWCLGFLPLAQRYQLDSSHLQIMLPIVKGSSISAEAI
jgi:hypothetical protein